MHQHHHRRCTTDPAADIEILQIQTARLLHQQHLRREAALRHCAAIDSVVLAAETVFRAIEPHQEQQIHEAQPHADEQQQPPQLDAALEIGVAQQQHSRQQRQPLGQRDLNKQPQPQVSKIPPKPRCSEPPVEVPPSVALLEQLLRATDSNDADAVARAASRVATSLPVEHFAAWERFFHARQGRLAPGYPCPFSITLSQILSTLTQPAPLRGPPPSSTSSSSSSSRLSGSAAAANGNKHPSSSFAAHAFRLLHEGMCGSSSSNNNGGGNACPNGARCLNAAQLLAAQRAVFNLPPQSFQDIVAHGIPVEAIHQLGMHLQALVHAQRAP
jgi:hypothetical protein